MASCSSQRHPYHEHELKKVDTRRVYAFYEARWRCDCCQRHFNGLLDEDHSSHHCHKCEFDMCDKCFKGALHSFHNHYLKPAKPAIAYPSHDGQWRCDACQRVFSPLTSQVCYHCTQCEVDLCRDCHDGRWYHVLHANGTHPLKPIDPRIEYRCFSEWQCEHCGTSKGHGKDLWTLFHCQHCDTNICLDCFSGRKHHEHAHGLVRLNQVPGVNSTLYCHICSGKLGEPQYYACRDPTCQFTICQHCYTRPAKLSPLHDHILYRTDPLQAYPQTGGVWHCDHCTNTHPLRQQTPLPPTAPMFHCHICQFDLCETCNLKAPYSASSVARREQFGASKQHTYLISGYAKPSSSRPPVTYIPSPPSSSIPAPTICRRCGLSSARLTVKHANSVHTQPLYCQQCAVEAVTQRLACPLCGQPPDGVREVNTSQ